MRNKYCRGAQLHPGCVASERIAARLLLKSMSNRSVDQVQGARRDRVRETTQNQRRRAARHHRWQLEPLSRHKLAELCRACRVHSLLGNHQRAKRWKTASNVFNRFQPKQKKEKTILV